jgi:tetratricopeptide (TPR) repeat protein
VFAIVFALLASPGTSEAPELERERRGLLPRVALGALGLILLVQSARLLPGEYYGEQARVALRDEDPAAALAHATTALAHESQNPYIYFRAGRALVALARRQEQRAERTALYERALAAFDNARQLAPLDGSYPAEIAYVYDQLGRFEEAEAIFALARARDPRSTAVAEQYRAHQQLWEAAKQDAAGDAAGTVAPK